MQLRVLKAIGNFIRTDTIEAATVRASDLRAGAALVLAGLIAEGETEIREIHHIERGYSSLIEKLHGIGAEFSKVKFSEKCSIRE